MGDYLNTHWKVMYMDIQSAAKWVGSRSNASKPGLF
jgi:hypothetical protein